MSSEDQQAAKSDRHGDHESYTHGQPQNALNQTTSLSCFELLSSKDLQSPTHLQLNASDETISAALPAANSTDKADLDAAGGLPPILSFLTQSANQLFMQKSQQTRSETNSSPSTRENISPFPGHHFRPHSICGEHILSEPIRFEKRTVTSRSPLFHVFGVPTLLPRRVVDVLPGKKKLPACRDEFKPISSIASHSLPDEIISLILSFIVPEPDDTSEASALEMTKLNAVLTTKKCYSAEIFHHRNLTIHNWMLADEHVTNLPEVEQKVKERLHSIGTGSSLTITVNPSVPPSMCQIRWLPQCRDLHIIFDETECSEGSSTESNLTEEHKEEGTAVAQRKSYIYSWLAALRLVFSPASAMISVTKAGSSRSAQILLPPSNNKIRFTELRQLKVDDVSLLSLIDLTFVKNLSIDLHEFGSTVSLGNLLFREFEGDNQDDEIAEHEANLLRILAKLKIRNKALWKALAATLPSLPLALENLSITINKNCPGIMASIATDIMQSDAYINLPNLKSLECPMAILHWIVNGQVATMHRLTSGTRETRSTFESLEVLRLDWGPKVLSALLPSSDVIEFSESVLHLLGQKKLTQLILTGSGSSRWRPDLSKPEGSLKGSPAHYTKLTSNAAFCLLKYTRNMLWCSPQPNPKPFFGKKKLAFGCCSPKKTHGTEQHRETQTMALRKIQLQSHAEATRVIAWLLPRAPHLENIAVAKLDIEVFLEGLQRLNHMKRDKLSVLLRRKAASLRLQKLAVGVLESSSVSALDGVRYFRKFLKDVPSLDVLSYRTMGGCLRGCDLTHILEKNSFSNTTSSEVVLSDIRAFQRLLLAGPQEERGWLELDHCPLHMRVTGTRLNDIKVFTSLERHERNQRIIELLSGEEFGIKNAEAAMQRMSNPPSDCSVSEMSPKSACDLDLRGLGKDDDSPESISP